jgi:hypothetical protein
MSGQIARALCIIYFADLYSALMGKKIRVVIDVTERGRAGGRATAAGRTAEERKEVARQAAQARWAAYYAEHPEKRKTARTGGEPEDGGQEEREEVNAR